MVRRTLVIAVVALAALTLPLAALAGGWAITSFDELPSDIEAGRSYDLSYTILQHGQTPVDVAVSTVRITDAQGQVSIFNGTRVGLGRYTVSVTFPTTGTFFWEVTQGSFEPHSLGTVTIDSMATATTAGTAGGLLGMMLPIALVLVILLVAVQLVALLRKRQVPTGPVRAD
jgi:hypothetical protein